jgi:hypothetical protein
LHDERVSNNAEFNYLSEAFAYRKARSEDDTISLNEKKRLQEKTDREVFWLALENKRRVALGKAPITSLDELDKEERSIVSDDAPHANEIAVPESTDGETTEPDSINEMANSASPISVLKTDDAHEKLEEEEEDTTPDPFLVESGHILLDLISLEERTAAGLKRSRDT